MTDLNRASVYVPITSITKADEGRTRIVTGVAASERLDMDGQRADYQWAKAAAGEWFKRWGNVREQHGGIAAGKAINIQFDDAGKSITVVSKAVDPGTIAKLDEGILTGYSWGAKSVPGNPIKIVKESDGFERVKGGAWAELSYVDHPCNYDCTIAITKAAAAGRIRATKVLGYLSDGDIPGGQDFDAILKKLLADIAKRDVSAAERERLGDKGHAVDTGQDHPSYPIANEKDLGNAIKAYGRAAPEDRAKVRRHIISEARRLGRTDMIPDNWKSVDGLLKQSMTGCGCCDDCGPDCQGDCCDQCRQMADAGKGATIDLAPGPAGILAGVAKLAADEPDPEFHGFLAKVASAVEGWSKTDGAAVEIGTYATLAGLAKAAGEPNLAKRRTFYSGSNRAEVEQVMQQLHQVLGLFMEGATATDLDKDQRNNTLTGQDAPAPGDQPGGPGTAPGDGVPGDGNLALDPELVRDGDPAVRTPDGQRDGRAQDEAGRNTRAPAGDQPGAGPGDQGKGQAPGSKGREPDPRQAQQGPSKATKKLRKLETELAELRKAAAGQSGGQPAIALQQTLGPAPRAKDASKPLRAELRKTTAAIQELIARPPTGESSAGELEAAVSALLRKSEKRTRKILFAQPRTDASEPVTELREEIKALGTEVHKTLEAQRTAASTPDGARDTERLEQRLSKRLRRMQKRLDIATAPPNPLEAQIAKTNAALQELASHSGFSDPQRPLDMEAAVKRIVQKHEKRVRRLVKRLDKPAASEPAPNPLEAQIAELRAVIAGQATKAAGADNQNTDNTLLLMADLTRTAFDQARKDSTEQATWLGKRVKRAERRLRKAASAEQERIDKLTSDVRELGRLPHPGGPHVAARPVEKTFDINDSIERRMPPSLLSRAQVLREMAESSDRAVATEAGKALKSLLAEVTG